jgi:membrane-bound metal-dependent hydrolase YbcI (DUF457 family)
LPGLWIGDPAAFHHGISHSIGFAVIFGGLVFFLLRYFKRSEVASEAGLMAVMAYALHTALDAVSVNEGATPVPLLWPISRYEFGINLGLLGHFRHDEFINGVWSIVRRDNLSALTREAIFLGIPLLVVYLRAAHSTRTASRNATLDVKTTKP